MSISTKDKDMDLAHYDLNDLYNLFHLSEEDRKLSAEEQLKLAKKLMVQTHPDKSRLPDKYFQFFQSAYKKISTILTTKNALVEPRRQVIEEAKETNQTLDVYFDQHPELLDPSVLNKWLNEKFEQHIHLDKPKGHGDWLASDEGVLPISPKIANQEDLNRQFDKLREERSHQLVVCEVQAWNDGGSLDADYLGNPDDVYEQGYGSSQGKYFDVREAYGQSIIPVFNDQQNERWMGENAREAKTILMKQRKQDDNYIPMSKEQAEQILFEQNQKEVEKERERKWYQTTQTENLKKQTQLFQGELLYLK